MFVGFLGKHIFPDSRIIVNVHYFDYEYWLLSNIPQMLRPGCIGVGVMGEGNETEAKKSGFLL